MHKTEKIISTIAIDQAHEQNNKVIKEDGGAIGLTEHPSALRRLMVADPEISRILGQLEDNYGENFSHDALYQIAQKVWLCETKWLPEL